MAESGETIGAKRTIMKKLFSLIALLFSAVISFAQSSMLATLNHEGIVSTFYGTTALREAHAAAAHGDVITLSSGMFTSVDITKAITLRGAGMEVDTISKIDPTVITGDFLIQIADSISQRLTIEGIYHNHAITYSGTLKNAMLLKSRFKGIGQTVDASMKDVSFIHCRIADYFVLNSSSSVSCINCAIEDPHSLNETSSNFEFQNCILKFSDLYGDYIYSSIFRNCIILYNTGVSIQNSCMAYNCVGSRYGMFNNIPNTTNKIVEDIETIFKTYAGQSLQMLDDENFELTDEAKTKYLGTDGTQVGIYGGVLPFCSTPSNPQITKCNVAAKSTADGKLSVDIEVKVAE